MMGAAVDRTPHRKPAAMRLLTAIIIAISILIAVALVRGITYALTHAVGTASERSAQSLPDR